MPDKSREEMTQEELIDECDRLAKTPKIKIELVQPTPKYSESCTASWNTDKDDELARTLFFEAFRTSEYRTGIGFKTDTVKASIIDIMRAVVSEREARHERDGGES